MDVKNLSELFQWQTARLKSAGIPLSNAIIPEIQINTRAKRRLGCCIYKDGLYTIEVSSFLLEQGQEEKLEETIAHELLHTCYGCRNHGKRWKYYAEKVNALFGYRIERTVKMEGMQEPLRQDEIKYFLRCKKCGILLKRMRMSNAVKYPQRYRCRCGGQLTRIQ